MTHMASGTPLTTVGLQENYFFLKEKLRINCTILENHNYGFTILPPGPSKAAPKLTPFTSSKSIRSNPSYLIVLCISSTRVISSQVKQNQCNWVD